MPIPFWTSIRQYTTSYASTYSLYRRVPGFRDLALQLDTLGILRSQAWSARNAHDPSTPGGEDRAKYPCECVDAPSTRAREIIVSEGSSARHRVFAGVAPGDILRRAINLEDPSYKAMVFLCKECSESQSEFWEERMKLYSIRGKKVYVQPE